MDIMKKYKPIELKMNSLQDRIYELEHDRDLMWPDTILLELLYKKSEALGMNPTEKHAAQAVAQAEKELDEYLQRIVIERNRRFRQEEGKEE